MHEERPEKVMGHITRIKQKGICCPCGRSEILALGLCASCYSMKRQDEEKYGGLREAVLVRDGRRCRACPNIERRKLCVHHRVPGVSKLELMITLCTACHAIVERTQMVLGEMTPLLLLLWREKHPGAQEQLYLPLDSELPKEMGQFLIGVEAPSQGDLVHATDVVRQSTRQVKTKTPNWLPPPNDTI